jgi:hypothetical protein
MSDLLELCIWFMSSTWEFFTQTYIPGTEVSVAVIFIGLLFTSVGFGLLSLVTGFPVGAGSITQAYGSSGSRKVKVSDARKNDTR